MFCPNPKSPHSAYPVTSTAMKAAETRYFLKVAWRLAEEYNTGTDEHQIRLVCFKRLAQFYDVLENADMFLAKKEFDKVWTAAWECLQAYSALSAVAIEKGQMRWSQLPKHHFFAHLAQQSRYLNPRWSWTYGFEDFVGTLGALATASCSGTAANIICLTLVDKYRMGVHDLFGHYEG